MTKYCYESFCQNCCKTINAESQIFVHYITFSDICRTGISCLNWPNYITYKNTDLQSLQSRSCSHESKNAPVFTFLPSKIIFIEFVSDAVNKLSFHNEITVCIVTYTLRGVAFCNSRHSTCVVSTGINWLYIDDMCQSIKSFPTTLESYGKD